MRYDFFVAQKLNISKNKAKELIEKGHISLNAKFFKASFDVKKYAQNLNKNQILNDEDLLSAKLLNLELLEKIYVSRAAFKLKAFLEEYSLEIRDKTCLDVGSSTGGFVQVLLEFGAKSIWALDVGKDQLHLNLRQDLRVKSFENTDLRSFKCERKFDLITCDVSFISLLNLIFYIDNLASKDIVLLFKPQFEVGKDAKRNSKGVLLTHTELLKARQNFEKECFVFGWVLKKCAQSKLKGKEGNIEYFYHFSKAKD